MTDLVRVQGFVNASRSLSDPKELQDLLQEINQELGFDYFALIHRIDLPLSGPTLEELNGHHFIALSDYPEPWIEAYIAMNLAADDPVLIASKQAEVGFRWSEIPQMIDLTPAHREKIRLAREAGIGDGFTVPANLPGVGNGSCHFVVRPERKLPTSALLLAELVGIHAFHAARLIVMRRQAEEIRRPKLSPRQRDCIELVARGKTDWEIAQILGISPATVKDYLDDARANYGVGKRIQVVLRAVFDGHLSLADMVI